MQYTTFSIVIPAYNEEKLIEETLTRLCNLDYPKDKYEVVLVINGTTDKTFEKAEPFASETFKIFNIPQKGVSVARNFGIKHCSPSTEWYIMLDADSYLTDTFLQELNTFVQRHPDVTYGTAFASPSDHSLAGKIWFTYINYGVKLLKMFCGIHIVKRESIDKAVYAEHLVSAEDIAYAKDLSRHGKYFSLKTKNYFTSTRRLKKEGYIKMFFVNIFVGILPNKTWEEIR
jgi:glycosyltransferase involved in cell wall biosynthesis